MRSLRTKITLLTLFVLVITVVIITAMSVLFIRKTENQKSDQLLLLMCETGEKNLDYYFNSVQKSVAKVAAFTESDLDGLDEDKLERHMERVRDYFDEMANKTNGVLTYYYRVDPEVSERVKGFWYVDLDGNGFVEHEVTDITKYDTSDTSKLVWFTVPKYEGESIWLPPYITDTLNWRVISYNVPIYWRGQFVGVVGIEIDYSTMAEQVDSIRLYNNAFLNDAEGNLFYHPRLDVAQMTPETMPKTPDGVVSESTFVRYKFQGVDRVAAWLPLSNGMRLNVTVPLNEAEGDWQSLIWSILAGAIGVLGAAALFTMFYTRRITRPIKQLTAAADQVDRGNYNVDLTYHSDDEVGRLTKTFTRLAEHMREHITDLNKQVYVDALTHVKNKGAFSAALEELQGNIDVDRDSVKFAIGVFDCDDLKAVNDLYGHEKGDIYLKSASHAICGVFHHSPVFRIGGDEFSVILRYEDYQNRDILAERFEQVVADINSATENEWEKVFVSMGIAEYDPQNDNAVIDVVRRADKIMYENKRLRKKAKAASSL